MGARINVLVVEDQELLRDALVAALEIEADVVVVGAAPDLAGGRALMESEAVDVAVVDYRLPDGVGTDLEAPPDTRRLLMTGNDDQRAVRAAIDAGFQGFVAKGSGIGELAQAVRVVHAGGAIFPAELLTRILPGTAQGATLTDRERDILDELAHARPLNEIASRHHLSIHTVRNHVSAILTKLGARSQLEAVVIAARSGLVEL